MEKKYYVYVERQLDPLVAAGSAVRGTATWDQALREHRNPDVEVTPPDKGDSGRPLSEHERIEFMVNKQEAQRQAQGFQPSDTGFYPQVGFTVYQQPLNLNYDKDLVIDRVGMSGNRNEAQKFWKLGDDHSSVYDRVYYDRRNEKYRRNDPAWDTERENPDFEPAELDDMNNDLQRKNRDVIRYVSHVRNVGNALLENSAFSGKIASIPKALNDRYKIIRLTQREFGWMCQQGGWYRIYDVRGETLGERIHK